MNDKVILVTPPDDVQLDGVRILLAGLSPAQQQIVSIALGKVDITATIVSYIWDSADFDWSIDKKHKSDLIIFNAEYDDLVVGYLAAQRNSHYFGNLKLFNKVNSSAIYDVDHVVGILENTLAKHSPH